MKKLLLVLLIGCAAPDLFAEGYQVNLQSARQTGMGHVGAALKLGAESMHFNPAGLVFMPSAVDLSAGGSAVFATASYRHDGYKAETDNTPSTPFFVYAGFRIYDNLAAGISVTTPYGSSLNWGKNWAGAHLIQDISLQAFSIQPTLSYKIMDKLSIGAGLMIEFGNVSLSRALLPVGALQTIPNIGALLPDYQKYNDVAPVSATLKGNSGIGVGFNVGAMYDVTEQVTVGVSYRSKVHLRVKNGTAALNYAGADIKSLINALNNASTGAGGKPVIPPLEEGTFRAKMPLPANLNIGVSYRPNARLQLSAEAQIVFWKAYKELNIHFNEAALEIEDIYALKDYKNTCIYRLGAEYALTNRFDIRGGIYYDQTPIREERYNPETPGMDKLGISAGLSFRPIRPLSIDFAFLYIQGLGANGSYPNPSALDPNATFKGKYQTVAFVPSLGLTLRF